MDQNTVKRKIATALAVCLLAASAAPAVLAEDTGIALMEATPSEPTRAALKLTRITPGNGTLEVELTGTLCKSPNRRTTPMGREICDLMLAVNRLYGRSDYLPASYGDRTRAGPRSGMSVRAYICSDASRAAST